VGLSLGSIILGFGAIGPLSGLLFSFATTVEPLLSGWSGTHHCPYPRKVCNLELHAIYWSYWLENTRNVVNWIDCKDAFHAVLSL